MSVLGQPYRILYLARGSRTGLTDVMAAVFRPDNSVVGIYPLTEAPGMFRGCYYYDYLSSIDDREGEYFSRVVSPTEGMQDIVRFSLYKSAASGAEAVLRPVQLTGYLEPVQMGGEVTNEDLAFLGFLERGDVTGWVTCNDRIRALLGDNELTGTLTSISEIE